MPIPATHSILPPPIASVLHRPSSPPAPPQGDTRRWLTAAASSSLRSPTRRARAEKDSQDAAKKAAGAKDQRVNSLMLAIKQIEHAHGKGALMKFGDRAAQMKVDVVPTGSLALDRALGEALTTH
jgi:hypothetical protein